LPILPFSKFLFRSMPASPTPTTPRVLVLDDHEEVRRLITKLLRKLGCEVFAETDDAVASDRLEECRFDLVIQDYSRDKGDGATFLRRIRDVGRGGARVPVVFVTGQTEATVREGLAKAGLDFDDEVAALISKPFEMADLVARIQPLLGQRVGLPLPPGTLKP